MRRFFRTLGVAALAASLTLGAAAQSKGSKGKDQDKSKESQKIEDLITKGEYQKAVDLAQKFIAAGQVTEGLYIDLGVAHYNLKNYEAAIQAFEKAVEQNPFGTQALLYEATCYHDMGQEAKAAEAFQRAIDVDPTNNEVRYNIAQLYEKSNRPQDALAQYKAIYQQNPDFKDVAFAAGILLFNQGQYAEAEPYFEKAAALNPNDEQVLLAVGQNLLKTDNYDKAIPALLKYVEVTKNDTYKPAVLDQVAIAYEKQKNYEGALATYDRILALRPNWEKALLGKGNALVNLKRYAEAVPVLKSYLEISKNEEKKKAVQDLLKQVEPLAKKSGK
jgi:tetratricopeptide (TPR) repeat protein